MKDLEIIKPGKKESKAERIERLSKQHEELQRKSICERLLLPPETTREEIDQMFSPHLVNVLACETAYGVTVQNKDVEGFYKEELEKFKSEPKIEAEAYVKIVSERFVFYDDEKIQMLLDISTKEEALKNELRAKAKEDMNVISKRLKDMELFTNVDEATLRELHILQRRLQIAIGSIRGEQCFHDDNRPLLLEKTPLLKHNPE